MQSAKFSEEINLWFTGSMSSFYLSSQLDHSQSCIHSSSRPAPFHEFHLLYFTVELSSCPPRYSCRPHLWLRGCGGVWATTVLGPARISKSWTEFFRCHFPISEARAEGQRSIVKDKMSDRQTGIDICSIVYLQCVKKEVKPQAAGRHVSLLIHLVNNIHFLLELHLWMPEQPLIKVKLTWWLSCKMQWLHTSAPALRFRSCTQFLFLFTKLHS